jgi:hypothetical protein
MPFDDLQFPAIVTHDLTTQLAALMQIASWRALAQRILTLDVQK